MKPKSIRNFSILGAIVFTATAAHAAVNNLLISDGFGNSSFSTAGLPQQETATAAGTITTAGSLAVTITSATVAGSPLVINVPVALGDAPATWSPKVVAALNANPAITARFSAGGTAPAIVLTGNFVSPLPAADPTLNIEIANGTAAGITPVVTSANTRNPTSAWTDGLAPAPGNTYFTGANLLRTPTANADVTFLGDSLQFDPLAGDNNSLLYKITGNRTVTINNLILNGAVLANGENNTTFTLAGNVNVTAVSGLRASDAGGRALIVTAPISGASRVYIGSNSTPQANTFTLSGNNTGFSGGFSLGGTYTNNGAKVFNASASTLRVGNVNALGTGVLELKEGTLNLNGFSPTGLGGLTVPDAGSATIRTAGSTITATAVNLGTTTGASLKIDNAGLANPVTAPIASTTLTVNGPSTLSVVGTGLSVGTFPLISHTGAIAGAGGFAGLSLALPPGVSGTLLDNPGSLDVNITGIEFIKWTGAISNNWNINSADTNWKTAGGNVPTTYQQTVAGGNSVLFDESEAAASPVAVAVPATVSPNAFSINNPTKNYTFSGAGGIGGTAAFVKGGAGTVTFSNALSCTGGTTINGGKVALAGAAPSASTLIPTSIASGATLEFTAASAFNQGGIAVTGAGSILKSGAGTMKFNSANSTIALGAGGLIDVQGGKIQFGEFDAQNCSATSNQSDMNIAAGATFDAYSGSVAVDKLTGSGTYQAGYFGPRPLTVGVAGGSSTFSGTIQGNGVSGISQTQLIKRGNGTFTLTGKVNASGGAFGTSSVEVRGGTLVSPSTLNLNPTDPLSTTGYTGGRVHVAPANSDVAILSQTAGTVIANTLSIGESGQATYNISGGTINTTNIEIAYNGGAVNGPAALNVSGTAQVNLNGNGYFQMGQFFGRPITVTQSGGNVVFFSDAAGTTRGGTGTLRFFGGNQNLTWNLSGGTLSLPGISWQAAGGGAGGGNGVLNFNGGILQITNAAFAAPTGDVNLKPKVAAKVLGDKDVPNSGATIDNYGLAVTFAAPIQHGPTVLFDGGLKVETSVPGGSLTLSGINTYTGNTTVPTGNSFILADNAGLTFVLDGTLNNKVTGAGTVSFSGDFTIDTTFADLTNGNSWTLVDAPIPPGTFTSSFSLVGFSEIGETGEHKKTEGLNTWTFNEGTGVLSLSVSPLSGYALWISNYDVGGLDQPTDDAEFDGTENLLEYILNGNPTVSDPVILPTLDDSGANFVFSFTRVEDTINDTTQIFQYGSDLMGWTSVNITAPTGPEVSFGILGVPSAGLRTVTVTIPKSAEVGGKLFGRLKASKP